MLGVRRSSVTVTAGALQQAGIINYKRGKITILDQAALKETSCESYRDLKAEFSRLLDFD
jgi:Mn-dependent DtxR family transcriptional regulator